MKIFKRSQTSEINYNNDNRSKKMKLINQKFEETIEKIAAFLNQNEHNANSNKIKDNKKNEIFKKKELKKKFGINNEIFNLDVINYILNKVKKSQNDILIVKEFLSSMNFISTLKGTFNSDKLLYSLSNYLKMEKKAKDTLIFRFGNKGNKFYVLLKGEVSVLILKEQKVKICFKKYFLHLLLLKMLKEDELVKKTITMNSKFKFHFDDRDFDTYCEKIENFVNKYMNNNVNKLKKNKEDNQNFFGNNKNKEIYLSQNRRLNQKRQTIHYNYLRNNYSSKFLLNKNSDSDEEEEESEEKDINYANTDLPFFNLNDIKEIVHYYIYIKEKIEQKNKNISVKDYIKMTYIDSPYHKTLKSEEFSKKEDLILFQYFEITKKKSGDSFGELALQREDNKRTGTIITITDCILGILSRNDYNSYLGDIEVKKRRNEVNFVMSFSIFDKMNKIVFENRFFNFFTKETFFQGQNIIIQDEKINKVFFIMDGQFEIMTNLSLYNIYSLLHKKTKRILKEDKNKNKFPKEDFNLRLYISYNKDILGLADCCYDNNNDIAFITAKCLSDKSVVFTIEKSILNEIRHKISDINKNINIIIAKREGVMVDRLANIYNRIIRSIMKNKSENYKEDNKNNDTFNYINYFFGINQGDRNSNIKKISTKTPNERVRSAIAISLEKKFYENFNELESINSYENEQNENIISNMKYNFRSPRLLNYFKKNKRKSEIQNEIDDISKTNENINNNIFLKEIESIYPMQKTKDFQLNAKMNELIDSSTNRSKSANNNLVLKTSKKINFSNIEKKEKYQMIKFEYSKLFNWIEKQKNKRKSSTIDIKKRNSKLLFINKTLSRKNSSARFFLSNKISNKSTIDINIRNRPLSNIKKKKIFSSRASNSRTKSIFNPDFDNKSSIFRPIKNFKNKRRTSRAISPDLDNPINLKGKFDLEKYLKQILGTKYKEQYISYEEQKFNKLIESYDIRDNFLKKAKKFKLKLKSVSQPELIKVKKEYKKINNKLKDVNNNINFFVP